MAWVYLCAKTASLNLLKAIFTSSTAATPPRTHTDPSNGWLEQAFLEVVMTCPKIYQTSWFQNKKSTRVFKKKTSERSSDCWEGLQPATPRPPDRLYLANCLTFGGNVSSKHTRRLLNQGDKNNQIFWGWRCCRHPEMDSLVLLVLEFRVWTAQSQTEPEPKECKKKKKKWSSVTKRIDKWAFCTCSTWPGSHQRAGGWCLLQPEICRYVIEPLVQAEREGTRSSRATPELGECSSNAGVPQLLLFNNAPRRGKRNK